MLIRNWPKRLRFVTMRAKRESCRLSDWQQQQYQGNSYAGGELWKDRFAITAAFYICCWWPTVDKELSDVNAKMEQDRELARTIVPKTSMITQDWCLIPLIIRISQEIQNPPSIISLTSAQRPHKYYGALETLLSMLIHSFLLEIAWTDPPYLFLPHTILQCATHAPDPLNSRERERLEYRLHAQWKLDKRYTVSSGKRLSAWESSMNFPRPRQAPQLNRQFPCPFGQMSFFRWPHPRVVEMLGHDFHSETSSVFPSKQQQ